MKISWVLILCNWITCSLLQGCGFESICSQIFFILMLNLGIANGAKVGLMLRLGISSTMEVPLQVACCHEYHIFMRINTWNDETTTHSTYASQWMVEFYVYLIYMVSLWPTDKFFACYLWLCAISILWTLNYFRLIKLLNHEQNYRLMCQRCAPACLQTISPPDFRLGMRSALWF